MKHIKSYINTFTQIYTNNLTEGQPPVQHSYNLAFMVEMNEAIPPYRTRCPKAPE